MAEVIDRRALHSFGLGLVVAALAAAGCGAAERSSSQRAKPRTAATVAQAQPGPLRARGGPQVATVATGLQIPWEIAFLPDRRPGTRRPSSVRPARMSATNRWGGVAARTAMIRASSPIARLPPSSERRSTARAE